MEVKREDILQVQYTREWSIYHLSIYGTEKLLCGKKLGIALELFDMPPDSDITKWCDCKACLKALKNLTVL